MIPPLFLIFRVRRFAFWFPLFLLWLFLFVLLSPVILLLAVVAFFLAMSRTGREWLAFAGQIWAMFCALRGTKINVNSAHERVTIQLY
jgi:Na+/glutamate symporter